DELLHYGAEAVRERVVDTGQTVTAAGVTSGIDLGLHLVDRLMGAEVAARIAAQMEWSPRPIGPSAEPLK
ncbi:MAG TPA: DJ-1/PfpI family protein, partial [Pseudomonadota bacterium]|nr:DJ-1/PfpI family protein [Pseudomonadota bacterium]